MNYIIIKNGLVFDFKTKNYIKKDVLIDGTKIKAVKDNITFDNENLKIINAKENYVLPGLVDCHTHIGILEECTGTLGYDNNETSNPVTPNLRAIDGVNPLDVAFKDAVKAGVTTLMTGPGSNNPIGGLNLVMKTYGNIIDNMVVKSPSGLKIAFGEDPLYIYGKNGKCPVTRMGIAALIREYFLRAQDYMIQKDNGKIDHRDAGLEAIVPVLKGDIILRAHAHRADDIVTAIRIAEEFNINKLIIEHGTEAHLIKDYIREKGVSVAFGPMLTPRIKMELKLRNYASSLELCEAGVRMALITDHPYNSIDQFRAIAALAVSEGLSKADALRFITSNPAEMLDCGDKLGSLKEGFDADIVIYNGDPLNIMSKVLMTIINGKIIYTNKNLTEYITK
ncbi:amidohydrolase [Candidatus Clostridium stratigraminis]|uniref:Amidohydrolase n=1 Tax=Candidatus Clostridium stratigraminis TaxID=3381661 RepID=A0ABW8SZ50_9CLOT